MPQPSPRVRFFCGCLAGTMDFSLLLKALCLVLVIEGIPLFLAPHRAREAALQVARMPGPTLRILGLVLMIVGASLLVVMK